MQAEKKKGRREEGGEQKQGCKSWMGPGSGIAVDMV